MIHGDQGKAVLNIEEEKKLFSFLVNFQYCFKTIPDEDTRKKNYILHWKDRLYISSLQSSCPYNNKFVVIVSIRI